MTSTRTVTEELLAWLRVSPREAQAPADWDALLAEAVAHSAAPQLFARLAAVGKTGIVPPAVMQCAMLAMVKQKQQVATLPAELKELLQALHDRGITPTLLKGAHLATLVYPELSHRPMADLDLLVEPSQLEAAKQALESIGYETRWYGEQDDHGHALSPMRKGSSIPVELHWTLTSESDAVQLDLDAMRARSEEVTLYGQPARVFSGEDLLLYICIHAGVMHTFGEKGLRPIFDILAILEHYKQLDWTAIQERAKAAGAARATWLMLELVRTSCNAPIPALAMPERVSSKVVDAARAQVFERPGVRLHDVSPTQVASAMHDPKRLVSYVFAGGLRGAAKKLRNLVTRYGGFLRQDRAIVTSAAKRTWRQTVLTSWMKKEISR